MMRNRNTWTVTMVNLKQIAAKKYRGCSTTKAVQNFCTRFGVNCFWWRPPQGSKKIFMVDVQNFRLCWKQVYGTQNFTHGTTRFGTTRTSTTHRPRRTTYSRTRTYSTGRTHSRRSTYRRAA